MLAASPAYASKQKDTILEILESNSITLNMLANNCLNAIKTKTNENKSCGFAALAAMEYSAYVGTLSSISEKELSSMVDLYISKYGKVKMTNNQIIINNGAKTSKKILGIYKSMLLN